MVANTYLKHEDDPNMNDPKTAVELYRQQRQALPDITLANAAMEDIYTLLDGVWQRTDVEGQDRVRAMWDKVQAIHTQAQAYDSTLDGADAALVAIQEQRKQVADELANLISAIENGDENDERLSAWAEEIRMDEGQASMDYAWEMTSEDYLETVSDNLELSYSDTMTFMGALRGQRPLTDGAKEYLSALFQEMQLSEGEPPLLRPAVVDNILHTAEQLGVEMDADHFLSKVSGEIPLTDGESDAMAHFFRMFGGVQ